MAAIRISGKVSLHFSASTSRAVRDVPSRELSDRRFVRCHLDDVYRAPCATVVDSGFVRVALARPDQRRIVGHTRRLREQGRRAELDNEVAEPSYRQVQRIDRASEIKLAFDLAAAI